MCIADKQTAEFKAEKEGDREEMVSAQMRTGNYGASFPWVTPCYF